MPLYGPWPRDDGKYDAIVDPSTFAEHKDALTPYVDATRPITHVLGQDDPANPQVTVPLLFPDAPTASSTAAAINMPAPVEPPPIPDEIAMERVVAVMRLTPSTHGGTLYDRVPLFLDTLPEPDKTVATTMWERARNLVVPSNFAQGFKAWEGLSDAQWGQFLTTAVHMAL